MAVYSVTGFIVIMLLIEFGGLGIISFIALYIAAPRKKVSLVNRSVIREFFVEDVETEPRKILKAILIFTFAIEATCAILLYFGFKTAGSARPVLDALFHSVSAFCNAGFSTYSDSLSGFKSNYLVLSTVMFLIISGGIGFTVLTDLNNTFLMKKKRLSYHSKVVILVTTLLILSGFCAFIILEYNSAFKSLSLPEKIFAALFQSVTPRTAGFEVVAERSFTPLSKLITILMMFIGGSPGSIAGGVKTTTFIIVVLYAIRGNTERTGFNLYQRNIETAVIEKAFSIVAKSLMLVFISISLLMLTEKSAIMGGSILFFDLVFEVVSAFGTVGLSQGITGSLQTTSKVVIILTMFLGRTGVFAMALGFAKHEKERFFEYPSASIMVG
jgi:trk system potassium uptake protein TrkH